MNGTDCFVEFRPDFAGYDAILVVGDAAAMRWLADRLSSKRGFTVGGGNPFASVRGAALVAEDGEPGKTRIVPDCDGFRWMLSADSRAAYAALAQSLSSSGRAGHQYLDPDVDRHLSVVLSMGESRRPGT